MGIPLQHKMDMSDPEEHVLWALVNIGGLAGVPLLLDERFMRIWSKHLHRCGFRHDPALQELWYKPPTEDATLFEGIGGEWVESEPGVMPELYSKDEVLRKMVASMSDTDRAKLAELIDGAEGDSDGGYSGE